MKATATALVSAVVIAGGWVSAPAVAFPKQDAARASQSHTCAGKACSVAQAGTDQKATCTGHAHSSTCGCARCAAARDD